MGYLFSCAEHYTKSGKIDRKAEARSVLAEPENIVKEALVGSVYYCAYDIGEAVIGVVIITKVDGFYVGTKVMDESMGPYYYDAPVSVLNALTPTDNEYANEWRRKCYENAEKVKPSSLPVGSKIQFKNYSGEVVTLVKMPPSYQFKTPWWLIEGTRSYWRKSAIPNDFTIVTEA